jgi:hypothetical protein
MNVRSVAIGIGLCSLVSAAPAGAVQNLTGTYLGKIRCESLAAGGVPDRSKQDVTVEIVHDGAGDASVEVVGFSVEAWIGHVVSVGAKPDIGILSAASCGFASPLALSGGVLQGPVKTKTGSDKASIRFVVTVFDEANLAQTCLVTAKRTSTTEPTLPDCVVATLE